MSLVNVAKRNKDGETHPTRYYSKKQESSVAKSLNGTRQKNSGATMFQKGDVVIDDFLLECKSKMTPSESISIKKSWIDKNRKEALFIGKPYNAVVFNFGPDEENFYIIDETLFQELINNISKGEING